MRWKLAMATLLLASSILFAQDQKTRVLLVASSSDPVRQAALEKVLKDAGFEVQVASSLVDSVFDVIVFESCQAASPNVASRLRQFVANGGGLVLIGFVPYFLSGKRFGQGYHDEVVFKPDSSIPSIAEWFGCGRFLGRAWANAAMDVPVCVNSPMIATGGVVAREAFLKLGERISVWQEAHLLPILDIRSMNPSAEVQAIFEAPIGGIAYQNPFRFGIESTHPSTPVRGAAALTHRYLQGRVYWQGWVEPNNERVKRLFLAGVMWAAKIGGIPPAKIEPLPPSVAEELARKIAEGLKQHSIANHPIAIMPFRSVGIEPEEAKRVQQVVLEPFQEDLTSSSINFGLRAVERAQLDKAIEELRLSASGLTDRDIALKLGRMIPGSLLVIGSLSPRAGGKWVINARVLETKRGKAIYAQLLEWASGQEGGRGISALPVQVAIDVARALAQKLRARKESRPLAVLAFRIVGTGEVEAKRWGVAVAEPFQEDLTTAFVREGVEVVERSQLDKALEEIRRSQSGLSEEKMAMELGKFLPGTLIVVGSLSFRGEGRWVINARVIETERGEGIAAHIYSFEGSK